MSQRDERPVDPDVPKSLPRWLTISAGLLLLPSVLLCGAGAVSLLIDPPGEPAVFSLFVGAVLLAACVWLAGLTLRLIMGRERSEGGLISPLGLRVIGIMFLLLVIGGVFTGLFVERPMIATLQALAYVSTFFGLRRIAASRQSRKP